MRKTSLLPSLLASSLLAFAAFADAPNPLIGKWVEKLANGTSMQTEFSEKSITSTPTDLQGKPNGAAITAQITYNMLGHDKALGDGFIINFVTPDGKPAGPSITAYLKNPDSLEMDFPGVSKHDLTRVK